MTTMLSPHLLITTRHVGTLVAATGLIAVLAACGSAGDSQASGKASSGPGGRHAAMGKVTAVNGSTVQVEQGGATTSVAILGTTSVFASTKATAADVVVGACIHVRPTPESATGTGPVVAQAISITPAADGACATDREPKPGAGKPSAPPASGSASATAPSESAPTGDNKGKGARARGGLPRGVVTAVSGSTITLQPVRTGEKTTITVTTSGTTLYTKRGKGTGADVSVGRCVVASGKTGDGGVLQATTIQVMEPTNGTCATRRPAGSAAQGSSPATS